jgi:RNA polymerase sigma factor (sigma-70 family)
VSFDRDAFLVEYHPYLKRMARQFAKTARHDVQRDELAQELLAEVSLALIVHLDAMNDETRTLMVKERRYRNRVFGNLFRDALKKTAQNRFESRIESLSKPARTFEDGDECEAVELVASELNFEDDILCDEIAQRGEEVLAALDALPEMERTAVRLRFGLDDDVSRSQAEVGEVMGYCSQHVSRILASALEKLRTSSPQEASLSDLLDE